MNFHCHIEPPRNEAQHRRPPFPGRVCLCCHWKPLQGEWGSFRDLTPTLHPRSKINWTSVPQITGTCQTNSWCDNNSGQRPVRGACPNDPNNVMCCIYPLCNNGICMSTSDSFCGQLNGGFIRFVPPILISLGAGQLIFVAIATVARDQPVISAASTRTCPSRDRGHWTRQEGMGMYHFLISVPVFLVIRPLRCLAGIAA